MKAAIQKLERWRRQRERHRPRIVVINEDDDATRDQRLAETLARPDAAVLTVIVVRRD